VSTALVEIAARVADEDVEQALVAARALRDELDLVEEQLVAEARLKGWSWAMISRGLGRTKQAIHSKYGHRALPRRKRDDGELLVSASARLAVFMARREAAGRGDSVVGTEHLLLGLLQQGEGGACEALKELGVTIGSARLQADLFFPSDLAEVGEPGRIPLSKAARVALEQATTEVVRRGERKLENAHLLLALMRDPQSRAVKLLSGLGVSRREVEIAADRQLAGAST